MKTVTLTAPFDGEHIQLDEPFRQADGRTRNRPAIVLRIMPPFGDLLVCGISRQLHHRLLRRLANHLQKPTHKPNVAQQ